MTTYKKCTKCGSETNSYRRRCGDCDKPEINVNTMCDSYIRQLISKSTNNYVENPTPKYLEVYRQKLEIKRQKQKFLLQI